LESERANKALDRWFGRSDLVLSAPFDSNSFLRSFMPATGGHHPARLLGFGSQMSCLAAVAKRAGRTVYLCGAPEIFSSDSARGELDRLSLPDASDHSFVHIRLGPARYARILRGIENVFFAAEEVESRSTSGGLNPYAANDQLPPAFDRILAGSGVYALPKRLSGSELPIERCDPGLPAADITRSQNGRPLHPIATYSNPALTNFADQRLSQMTPGSAARERWCSHPEPWSVMTPRALLLPWNLSNPVAVAPLLVRLIARHRMQAVEKLAIVLCPFNITWRRGQDIVDLVLEVKKALGDSPLLQNLWLAALEPHHVQIMSRYVHFTAWLDGQDSEVQWTCRRFRALDIESALVGSSDWLLLDALPALAGIYSPVLRSSIDVRDEFGRRSYVVSTPSPAQLSGWLDQEIGRAPRENVEDKPTGRPEGVRLSTVSMFLGSQNASTRPGS
jgi:hypothetical protein